ncbi:MAG: 2-amino-4-hydroxy-6-hydroxymethyldihydropteridine diphosphokinase [Anaerolineales bacterium]
MQKHIVYLALGSNIGDRSAHLRAARNALAPQVEIVACSSIYETPPWGYTDQPYFYNQVLQCTTNLSPQELLEFVKTIEQDLGRSPSFRNGPRTIDIDILFYDELTLNTPSLGLPHPRIDGRAFVWLPLAELAPQLIHPTNGKTATQIVDELDISQINKLDSTDMEICPPSVK